MIETYITIVSIILWCGLGQLGYSVSEKTINKMYNSEISFLIIPHMIFLLFGFVSFIFSIMFKFQMSDYLINQQNKGK